jgi:urease accessory protein
MLMPMPADVPATVLHQRAHGAFRVVFGCSARGTVLRDLHQAAPLRILFPQPEPGEPPLAALLNCAGGLAGGDQLEQSIELEAGATATLSTAAAEKVYRSLGPITQVATDIVLGAGATFEWLPQETILFDGARLQRRFAVALGEGAALLATEILVFGRGARGETWRQGLLRDFWALTRPEGLLWIDRQVLSPEAMAAPFGGVGAEAMGMLIVTVLGQLIASIFLAIGLAKRRKLGVGGIIGLSLVFMLASVAVGTAVFFFACISIASFNIR